MKRKYNFLKRMIKNGKGKTYGNQRFDHVQKRNRVTKPKEG